MQTLKIQNCTENRDSMMKIFVNGEKHIVSSYISKVQVDKDKPFKIRTKYIWGGSPEYTFEPKDNMTLQILFNQRLSKWASNLLIIAMILNIVQISFLDKGKVYVQIIFFLLLIVPIFVRRKRNFIIKEVTNEI